MVLVIIFVIVIQRGTASDLELFVVLILFVVIPSFFRPPSRPGRCGGARILRSTNATASPSAAPLAATTRCAFALLDFLIGILLLIVVFSYRFRSPIVVGDRPNPWGRNFPRTLRVVRETALLNF